MGGRGSSNSSGISNSNTIRKQMLEKAMGSKFKGVVRDAKAGKGNYGFKNAKAVDARTALKMTSTREHTKDGNVLIEGSINGKHVFFAEKEGGKTVETLREKDRVLKEKRAEESKIKRPEITPTSTYNRWRANNKRNFDAWFGKR